MLGGGVVPSISQHLKKNEIVTQAKNPYADKLSCNPAVEVERLLMDASISDSLRPSVTQVVDLLKDKLRAEHGAVGGPNEVGPPVYFVTGVHLGKDGNEAPCWSEHVDTEGGNLLEPFDQSDLKECLHGFCAGYVKGEVLVPINPPPKVPKVPKEGGATKGLGLGGPKQHIPILRPMDKISKISNGDFCRFAARAGVIMLHVDVFDKVKILTMHPRGLESAHVL